MPNRTIKTFQRYKDDFIRVTFLNDKHEKLMYGSNKIKASGILNYF